MKLRFISTSKNSFKIHVPTPEGGMIHRSVGFIRKGKIKARAEAIGIRNQIGRQHWKKFWTRVLHDEKLLLRISKMTIQPRLIQVQDTYNGKPFMKEMYCANWMDENGVKHFVSRGTKGRGRAAAYLITKRIMFDGIRRYHDILLFMEIITRADLRQVNTYLKDIKQ
ncbi:hypothetical protein [Vibrio harveyi]|uniref:hypothetical protein n=1 Tax=Vibrio harveyi TaxID=669 RepID=UPI003D71823C